jgi:hypothetical protein
MHILTHTHVYSYLYERTHTPYLHEYLQKNGASGIFKIEKVSTSTSLSMASPCAMKEYLDFMRYTGVKPFWGLNYSELEVPPPS